MFSCTLHCLDRDIEWWYDDETFVFVESVSVLDRNGSLETNDSSSPEASHQSNKHPTTCPQPEPTAPQFDFNDFFKIENIPGLEMVRILI